MKIAVKRTRHSGISVEDAPDAVRLPGEALLRVDTAGICGSDLHAYEAIPEYAWIEPLLPVVFGHEVTGTIVAIDADTGLQAGQRVAIKPSTSCGTCPACRRGQIQRCPVRKRIGYERQGGLATLVSAPVENLFPLPDSVDLESGSLMEPLTIAVHAVSRVRVRPGSTVAVVGAGAIGLLAVQVLRVHGAARVLLVGTDADEAGGGFAIAERLGAVPLLAQDAGKYAGLCETVINAAGAAAAVTTSILLLDKGGTLVNLALGIGGATVDMDQLVRRELTLVGAYGNTVADWVDALTLISTGQVIGAGIVSHWFALDDAQRGFDALLNRTARKVCILPNRDPSTVRTR